MMPVQILSRRVSFILLAVLLSFTLVLPVSGAQPVQQQDLAAISAPTDGQTLSGLVRVTGSANHPEFDRYELAFGPDPNPNDAWQVFSTGTQPVVNEALGLWDTAVVADGQWALRLRVVRKDSNYSESFVRGLRVSNSQPVASPVPTLPEATFPPEATSDLPTPSSLDASPQPIGTVMVERPPTSVPPVNAAGTPNVAAQPTRRPSNATTLFDLGEAGGACLNGALLAAGAMVVVGIVQLTRRVYKAFLRMQRKRR